MQLTLKGSLRQMNLRYKKMALLKQRLEELEHIRPAAPSPLHRPQCSRARRRCPRREQQRPELLSQNVNSFRPTEVTNNEHEMDDNKINLNPNKQMYRVC